LSNPLVRVADVAAAGEACRDAGVPLIVDATFTPPSLIRTLDHGASLAVHSATKYLGGHGDAVAGVLSGSADLIGAARARRTLDGTIADPFTAWLVLRGIKTLSLRTERQCANAARIAEHLQSHSGVRAVHYPGVGERDNEDERSVLEKLYPHGCYGAMLAFELAGTFRSERPQESGKSHEPEQSRESAKSPEPEESERKAERRVRRFVDSLRLWGKATTLGDLESLVLIPTMTSHRRLSAERREAMGIVTGMARLSVGIENVDDLIEDLDQGLAVCADTI